MSKLQVDIKDRMELLTYLETILRDEECLPESTDTIMADVEAIRNRANEDPEEISLFKASLRSALVHSKPMLKDTMRGCDDLIEGFAGSPEYTN
jgi:hypothetical protein